jgi:hypothetical protein
MAYCVYNQSCECFLSLGVMLPEDADSGGKSANVKEGSWLLRPSADGEFELERRCDLVYLDEVLRVIQVVEMFPTLRQVRWRDGAASVLVLPAHTIYASKTRAGHQLMIGCTEEMERQLRSIAEVDGPVERWISVEMESSRE